jgi:hypothetical protein
VQNPSQQQKPPQFQLREYADIWTVLAHPGLSTEPFPTIRLIILTRKLKRTKKIRAGSAPARKSGRAGEDRKILESEISLQSALLFSFIIMKLRAYRNAED